MNRLGIHPVIASILILGLAVLSAVAMQNWFNDFSSELFTDVETQSSSDLLGLGVEAVVGETLYARLPSENVTINEVTVDGYDCNISGPYSGITTLNISQCYSSLTSGKKEVVIITSKGIISETILLKVDSSSSSPLNPFISRWNTSLTSAGISNSSQIFLPLVNLGIYNFEVDWGDGSSDTITSWDQIEANHTYSEPGVYEIRIEGELEGWSFGSIASDGDAGKIIEISQWGNLKLGNEGEYFKGTENLDVIATDILNTSGITNFLNGFYDSGVSSIPNIGQWDMSSVLEMEGMFRYSNLFNDSIENWDVSSVTDMSYMFDGASSFNQPLNNWVPSSVNGMYAMFYDSPSFNQPLDNWNVSSVTNMVYMFYSVDEFNQNLSSWDVDQVTSCTDFDTLASSWTLPKPNFTSC